MTASARGGMMHALAIGLGDSVRGWELVMVGAFAVGWWLGGWLGFCVFVAVGTVADVMRKSGT